MSGSRETTLIGIAEQSTGKEMITGNTVTTLIIIFVIAYALGDINPAIAIGKLHHIDIRNEGSGNAGMTNTIRVIGLGAGIAVFVIDVLKGVIAVRLGIWMAGGDLAGGMAGFAGVVIGHSFPALYGFKGGKGVAASLGAVAALNWMSAIGVLVVAGVIFLVSGKRMSIASLGAAVSYPLFMWFLEPDRRCFYFAIAAALFLIIRHRDNIDRIAKGEEKSLTVGHKKLKDHESGIDAEAIGENLETKAEDNTES